MTGTTTADFIEDAISSLDQGNHPYLIVIPAVDIDLCDGSRDMRIHRAANICGHDQLEWFRKHINEYIDELLEGENA